MVLNLVIMKVIFVKTTNNQIETLAPLSGIMTPYFLALCFNIGTTTLQESSVFLSEALPLSLAPSSLVVFQFYKSCSVLVTKMLHTRASAFISDQATRSSACKLPPET